MKNKLEDLNNILFETLERLQDDEMTDEEFEKERKRSQAVVNVANAVIENGRLALDVLKHQAEYAYSDKPRVPAMLASRDDEQAV